MKITTTTCDKCGEEITEQSSQVVDIHVAALKPEVPGIVNKHYQFCGVKHLIQWLRGKTGED